MKKFYSIILGCTLAAFATTTVFAQPGTISTLAGTTYSGFSGDGGPATAAQVNQPARMIIDAAGNRYFSDAANNRIRKISPTGTISTIAGDGVPGFAGDGGPATAARLKNPIGLVFDAAGNLYIADQNNYRIRRIDPSGTITTVAGTGVNIYSGDGGPATAAGIEQVGGIAIDPSGNLYVAGHSNRVRKVSTSGTITTIAGTGAVGSSGDGGPATAATLNVPWDLKFDAAGNLYICEQGGNCIRMVSPAGIISTVAGNGTATYSGDGGPATAAGIDAPRGIILDEQGNMYVCQSGSSVVRLVRRSGIIETIAGTGTFGFSGDGGPARLAKLSIPSGAALDPHTSALYVVDANHVIRKVEVVPSASSDSMVVGFAGGCSGAGFMVETRTWHAGLSVKTLFGDGSSAVTPVTAAAGLPGGYISFSHPYNATGVYSVKHILMDGGIAVDSLMHTMHYALCNTLSSGFYFDVNSDCVYQPQTDRPVYLPVTVQIDSNGVPVDTITTLGGFNYMAYGAPGDVYAMRVIASPVGLLPTCPSSGVYTDTVATSGYSQLAAHQFGFTCSSTAGFDLQTHLSSRAGRHRFESSILIANPYCTPQAANLELFVTDKYDFVDASLPPVSTAGHVCKWDLSGLSSQFAPVFIHFHGEKPMPPDYTAGDTANSSCMVSPNTGDTDPENNHGSEVDTIRSSFDPNYIEVSPSGCVPATATKLEYTIGFENTGTDTAFNIYVLDTLPAGLDLSTLKVLASSANLTLTRINYGDQTILRFDFPGINLPDSSHHDLCHGMLVYSISTRPGLADLTQLPNRAGIYFDTNPVVMTNATSNTVNCPVTFVGEHHIGQLQLYPNPAYNSLTISTNGSFNTYHISNMMGQVQLAGLLNAREQTLDIHSLPAGMYMATFSGAGGTVVRKFVKM